MRALGAWWSACCWRRLRLWRGEVLCQLLSQQFHLVVVKIITVVLVLAAGAVNLVNKNCRAPRDVLIVGVDEVVKRLYWC